jgi:hypothetical protein
MQQVEHQIKHQYQPTNTTCSPTALSIILEHYGMQLSPLDIEKMVPQCVNDKGEKIGTIGQQLATWCLSNGFAVTMYTFDVQVIDQSWAKLDNDTLLQRLKLRKGGWVVPGMGEEWTRQYTQSYIDFVESGGKLIIQPAVTSKLLYELLESGPLLPCVSFSTLYGIGRSVNDGEDESKLDDVNGRAVNHSIVVYGNDESGNFLIADPWQEPGLHTIDPERLIAAISTAQIECDNLLFQIHPEQENTAGLQA